MFPLGKTGRDGEPEATLEETKTAIRQFWRGEMSKAVEFVEARMRHDCGEAREADLSRLHYLRRPRLAEVLTAIESFQQTVENEEAGESRSWQLWKWFGWRSPLQ